MYELTNKYKIPIIFGSIVLIFLLLGSILFIFEQQRGPLAESIEIQTNQEGIVAGSDTETILVDIAGSIKTPGLYELPIGTRIGDLIEAAGGITNEADSAWIARSLNKAEKLRDGMKIYIPGTNQASGFNDNSTELGSKISINSASQSELESLPGIGPKSAEKIIHARPFNSVDELLSKKVLGQSTFEKIQDQISLW